MMWLRWCKLQIRSSVCGQILMLLIGTLGQAQTTKLASGLDHSLAICKDSTVRAWGRHSWGQLGTGDSTTFAWEDSTHRNTPCQVLLPCKAVAVAAGRDHSLALCTDSTVWTWGWNEWGQLGTGDTLSTNIPVQVFNLNDAVAVSAGVEHSLALRADGTVWGWGYNNKGQLGPIDSSTYRELTPVQIPNLDSVRAIAAGDIFSLALRADSTVWAWGSALGTALPSLSDTVYPVPVPGLENITSVSASYDHSLALRADSTVWAWGWNIYGQLGIDTATPYELPPVQVLNLNDAVAVSAGFDHSLALRSDSTVWAWGSNWSGELGVGDTLERHVPTQVVTAWPGGITDIAGGGEVSFAREANGTLWSWGGNVVGQLGNGQSAWNDPFFKETTPVRTLCMPCPVEEPQGAWAAPDTICPGDTAWLSVPATASAGVAWKWYADSCGGPLTDAGATIAVSPDSTTTWYVNGGCGCDTTSCEAVTVYLHSESEAPLSVSVTPEDTICSGDSVTLARSGGALGSGASWQWYAGSCGGNVAGSGDTLTVAPGAATTYYVRAEGACNTTACASATVVLSTVPDSVTVSPDTLCPGDTATLTQTGGALGREAQWKWYLGGCEETPVDSGGTIQVSPSATQTYFVRAEGSCDTTPCKRITVVVADTSEAPVAAGAAPDTLCPGAGAVLSVSGGATGTYGQWQWYADSCGGSAVAAGATVSVTPGAPATYYVRAEGRCNVTTCAGPVDVHVHPALSLGSGSAPATAGQENGTAWVNAGSGTPPYNYLWDDPDNQTTDTAYSLTYGTYTVTVTDAAGCSDTITVVIEELTSLIDPVRDAPLYLGPIPNPLTQPAEVNYHLPEGTQQAYFVVYDVTGRTVQRIALKDKQGQFRLNPANFYEGMYIYSLQVDGVPVVNDKLIMQRP